MSKANISNVVLYVNSDGYIDVANGECSSKTHDQVVAEGRSDFAIDLCELLDNGLSSGELEDLLSWVQNRVTLNKQTP